MIKSFRSHWLKGLKLTMILSLLVNFSMLAQDVYSVSGTVIETETNGPAPGVSVIIKGTSTGTVTDFDGNYTIEVASGDILEFQYLGFATESVIVTGQTTIDVSLKPDTESLEEVVVVGYGTQKAKNLTGSIAKVSGEKVAKSSVARVDDALVGRVSGVQIAATNPEAGGDTTINVRGIGSITGDTSPLIVLDDMDLGNDPDILGTINVNDIKSVEVLKDASAVAIYGSRGANGVIILTTKDGVSGKSTFTYNSYFGTKWVPHNDTYTGSLSSWSDYINSYEAEAFEIGGDFLDKWYEGKSRLAAAEIIAAAGGGETDWQAVMLPGGTIQSHSFAVTGGADKTTYSASIGYLNDEGVLINDGFKRYTANLKLKSKSKNDKLTFGLNINGSFTDQDKKTENMTTMMRFSSWNPIYLTEESMPLINRANNTNDIYFAGSEVGDYSVERMYDNVFFVDGVGGLLTDANGNVIIDNAGAGNLSMNTTSNTNAYAKVMERQNHKSQTNLRASASLSYKLAKGLTFKQTLKGDVKQTTQTDYRGVLYNRSITNSQRGIEDNKRTRFGNESLLTYKRDLKKHSINAVAGFSFDHWNYTWHESDSSIEYTDDFLRSINVADPTNDQVLVFYGEDKLISYFGRLNYAFDDKYLLTLTARTDGSSRFGEEQKFGFFPAASIGWRVSDEAFLADSDVISNLKLRASYGFSGNNSFGSLLDDNALYSSLNTVVSSSYNGIAGVESTTLSNPNLGWERLREFSPGIDLALWNGKIDISADYYKRISDDLLLFEPLPLVTGASDVIGNIGEVENEGYELEVTTRIINNTDFSWDVTGQVSTNENTVTDFAGTQQQINQITNSKRAAEFLTEVGGPISTFYGYVYDSEVPIEDVDSPFSISHSQPNRVIVKDINGDGQIDADDRTVLGDPFPDFQWALSNNFSYKNFDLSFMFQGSHGLQVRTSDIEYLKNEFSSRTGLEAASEVFDQTVLRQYTSDYIKDASFVALRNVNVGYNFPSELINKINLSKLRLYVTGENLLYITADEYFGFNPEGASYTSDNANTGVTAGYQRGELPIAKAVNVGLNVEF